MRVSVLLLVLGHFKGRSVSAAHLPVGRRRPGDYLVLRIRCLVAAGTLVGIRARAHASSQRRAGGQAVTDVRKAFLNTIPVYLPNCPGSRGTAR